MNQANFPATKGMPLYKEDLAFLQAAYSDAFKAICSGFVQGGIDTFILSGCVVTTNVSGIQCTAGYMVYKGEVMSVDAVVNGFLLGEVVAAPVITYPSSLNPVLLSDLTPANIWAVRKATFVDDGLAVGENVPLSQIKRIEDLMRDTVLGTDTWRSVGASGQPAFQNGWVNETGTLFYPLAFKKTPNGQVLMRGKIRNTSYDNTKKLVFTLPVDYRPAKSVERFSNIDAGAITIKVYGNSELEPNRGKVEVNYNSITNLTATFDSFDFWLT